MYIGLKIGYSKRKTDFLKKYVPSRRVLVNRVNNYEKKGGVVVKFVK